jgi:poly(A) polymerase
MGDGWYRISPAMGEQAARALLYRIGPERFTDRALLAWSRSDAGASDRDWQALAGLSQRWIAPAFPIRAADLMARGLEKGPALGAAMRAAEETWIEADFPQDAGALERIAAAAVQGAQ